MDQLAPEDIAPKGKKKVKEGVLESGLSAQERQWKQVEMAADGELEAYIDFEGLAQEIKEFTYPLNFIDFETTRVAIPFHKGRRPYEEIVFQFSHHVLFEDGRVEHKNQYLNMDRGSFPNYDFVRALKKALGTDPGTIFRYADHENTVLLEVKTQLKEDLDPPTDSEELCAWIDSVTRERIDKDSFREGKNCMVDLKMLVQKYFYHPATKGSNSIKAVLPAVLKSSKFLRAKYSVPIYGAADGIPSLNFKDHQWIHTKAGEVVDPYKSLPPIFQDIEIPEGSQYEEDDRLAEGGAAMTAYGRMQFTEMSNNERNTISQALLRYCELDTLAMVMILEHWNSVLGEYHPKVKNKVAA